MADSRADLRLAVDIGNTNTVIGLFAGSAIARRWRLATRRDTTVDEIALQVRGLLGREARGGRIRAAGMASVVPVLDESWTLALAEALGRPPAVLDWSNCLGLKLAYDIPAQIGADRLANVLGAHALGHREGVVIDLGTATTYDVFGPDCYYGGIICPGIQSSLRGLAQSAAKLSEVELKWVDRAVGSTTEDALRIGMLQGTLGQVEYLLKAIFAEMKMRAPAVIATGGLAPLLGRRTRAIHAIEPDLTLIGINRLAERGPKKGKQRK
jgi:type III pantothenate kinase